MNREKESSRDLRAAQEMQHGLTELNKYGGQMKVTLDNEPRICRTKRSPWDRDYSFKFSIGADIGEIVVTCSSWIWTGGLNKEFHPEVLKAVARERAADAIAEFFVTGKTPEPCLLSESLYKRIRDLQFRRSEPEYGTTFELLAASPVS